MSWKAVAVIFAGLSISTALAGAGADANNPPIQEPPRRPFAPALTEGKDRPACADLQAALAQQFFSTRSPEFSLRNMPGMVPARIIPESELIKEEFRDAFLFEGRVQLHEVPAGGKDVLIFEIGIYLAGIPQPSFFLFRGTRTELKARLAEPKNLWSALLHGAERFAHLPLGGETHFYGSAGGVYFHTSGHLHNIFELDRLPTDNKVERLCTVRLLPDGASGGADAIVHGQSLPEGSPIGPLMQAFLRNFMWIYGEPFGYECGRQSSRLDGRYRNGIKARLLQAWYRPWRVADDGVSPDFSALGQKKGFEAWSTEGLWERQVYERFRDAPYDRIVAELVRYYRATFGYGGRTARALAARNFHEIASGLPFGGGYDYWGAPELQAMILRGVPLADIEERLSNEVSQLSEEGRAEEIHPLLLVSAGRPEVTKLLLDAGANPDAANAFGKTALMHAAQENDLESARLLLAAGSDVNAVTDGAKAMCAPRSILTVAPP